ncbi:hypothetical protein SAMN06297397_2427 [Aristaeella lactis]|uniref:Uncharacterized protein n=1 Tax=Aristaeella lactis TaxID=3046383 RepID=A0AC61PNI5_9FIRM|nr:hypothetical protein SAMN06297397_2427 [Aristaeella lactis]
MHKNNVQPLRLCFLFLWLQFILSIIVWNYYVYLLDTGFYQFEDLSSIQVVNRMFFLQIIGRIAGPLLFYRYIKHFQTSKEKVSVNRLKAFSVILICMGIIEFIKWKIYGISSENRIQLLCSSIYPMAFFAAYCFFTSDRDGFLVKVLCIGTICTAVICILPILSFSFDFYTEKVYVDYNISFIIYPIILVFYA